jgi:hypothetical protein
MTYKQLLQQLQQLNEEQLNSNVCIWDSYENEVVYQESVELVIATEHCQVLNAGHPIIRF